MMNVRLIFGKPLPKALHRRSSDRSWFSTVMLLAGAGVVTWVVAKLLARDARETDDMIYFWPE